MKPADFPPMPRRTLLSGLGAAATAALLPGSAAGQPRPRDSTLPAPLDGFRVIRAAAAGYDGAAAGPLLRVRRDEEVKVRLVNDLATETTIHWHGVRVPNAMDGTSLAQRPVAPGASFDYRFTPPDAGTFLYRPPLRTAQNRALCGLLIVQESVPLRVDDDVPLLIDGAEGKFTANGVAVPDIHVWPKHRIRLRLANASDKFVTLRIDGHPMTVVAIDGQPSEPFLSRDSRITLSPGNRADVLVDVVMAPKSIAPIVVRRDDTDVPFARLVYGDGIVAPGATMPDGYVGESVKPLPPNPLPERMDFRGAVRAELPLAVEASATTLPDKPLFSATRGRTVMLALANRTGAPQAVHIHGHHVRLLDKLDDGWKPFWLDTILCVPQEVTRVAFVADNPGKWLLNARPVGAETSQLAWFEVR